MKSISLVLNRPATATSTSTVSRPNIFGRLFQKQVDGFNNYAYGMMSLYIIGPSCLASVACMMLLQINAGMLLLLPGAMLTMLTNGLMIAQANTRTSLLLANLSILVSLITIIALSV